MNKERMVQDLKMHMIRKYGTQGKAAAAWGVSDAVVSRVMNHKILPTEIMLADVGLEMVKSEVTYRKVKKEKK